MSQLDAIALSEGVKQRLIDFALDDNFVRDQILTDICRTIWSGRPETGGLLSDLWIEGAFPAKTVEASLATLVKQGIFDAELCRHLDQRNVIPRQRLLYTHQYETIVKAHATRLNKAKPALVVTAGTGTGKTESFLLPILNALFQEENEGKKGVKCIILYPMNALVNDQVERLYNWLQGQSKITLFHFTSETPEDKRRANSDGIPEWDVCRMRTRQQARGLETHDGHVVDLTRSPRGPVPDILITNYSMLEYMLCRPQDAIFFGESLRAIALDEAHLYTGTLAAEITLLLRRLLERCNVTSEQVLHIATSATIGTGAAGELEQFASTLFTKEKSLVKVIQGQATRMNYPKAQSPEVPPTATEIAQRQWLDCPTITLDAYGSAHFAVNAQSCQALAKNLPLLVDKQAVRIAEQKSGDKPAMLLHAALEYSPVLQQIENILWERKRISLHNLTELLWKTTDTPALQSTIALLQMGASARQNIGDYPLLPHRIHILARPTEGFIVCLNTSCNGSNATRLAGLGCVSAGLYDQCPHCQSATLSLYRCTNCGEWVLAGIYNDEHTHLQPVPAFWPSDTIQFMTLQEHANTERIVLDAATGKYGGSSKGKMLFYSISDCPHCHVEKHEAWQPFVTSVPLTLSILAESTLAELPEYPVPYNAWLPAQGRRMLAFSDSRQEAARLGPRLTHQHETQLIRAAMVQCLREQPLIDAAVIEDLQEEIKGLQRQLAQGHLTSAQRQQRERKLENARQEFAEATVGGAIENWAEAMKRIDIVQQIIEPESSLHHEAEQWSQDAQGEWKRNFTHVEATLKSLLAREFARPTRWKVALETLGLAEITYPNIDRLAAPESFLGQLPTAHAREQLRTCWTALLTALCDTLRTDGVVTLGSTEDDNAYQFGSVLIGHWCSEDSESSRLIRFIGKTDRQLRRKFETDILQKCGLNHPTLAQYQTELLRAAFRQLQANAGSTLTWLQTKQQYAGNRTVDAIRIQFPQLGLRRPLALYRCPTTGHIWPREVLGCAPESGCTNLEQVDDDILDNDPRIMRQRREFTSSKVFRIGLWAEEHSAQLDPKENRRLQDLFKIGVRNILSSTTTMELGIDIGGLNAVLMSNVPPGKANYLQRAGRAGRRTDGSSVVITFCRPRPFDREVFLHFSDYLEHTLRRPRVFLDRKRVVRRHSHSLLLGEFFRIVYSPNTRVGAMNAFGTMGRFCGVELPPYWERTVAKPAVPAPQAGWTPANVSWWNPLDNGLGLDGHFLDYLQWVRSAGEAVLRPMLERLFQGTIMQATLQDWSAFLNTIMLDFTSAIRSWRTDFDNMMQGWLAIEDATHSNARAQANALRYQMTALYETTVIETLADRQFLPRYGFPIGMQRLRVIAPDAKYSDKIREEDKYRLERGGLVAMGEYVPGSQLLVGGKLITSHGLLKHWTGANINNYLGLRGQYTKCINDHFYYELSRTLTNCPICGEEPKQNSSQMLFPSHGFSSAAWDPPKLSTDVERVGHTERATITFAPREGSAIQEQDDFGGIRGLRTLYREDGEMLVYNAGDYDKGFVICLKCGYAESENKFGERIMNLPKNFKNHAPLMKASDRFPCWRDSEEQALLRNQSLAARQTTDVLMLDFSSCLRHYAKHHALHWTLAQALQIAGAKLLELDSRELGTLVVPAGEGGTGLGVVLYDNVPGGAGHVRELLDLEHVWLKEARTTLFINDNHNKYCETACLDCLLTFDAQEVMSRGLLQRKLALTVLDALLNNSELPKHDEENNLGFAFITPEISPHNNATSTLQRTIEERLQRGQQRTAKAERRNV